eukprot:scaffold1338_cov63-Phaeocystis_antarctica.AAC.7
MDLATLSRVISAAVPSLFTATCCSAAGSGAPVPYVPAGAKSTVPRASLSLRSVTFASWSPSSSVAPG